MISKKRGQAAFEYLSTYGWAIMTAMVAIGALAYFGFLNPSNLMPDKCDFGKQLECADFQIKTAATATPMNRVNLFFKNNFGKDIQITGISMSEGSIDTVLTTLPLKIGVGGSDQLSFRKTPARPKGEKDNVQVTVTFKRDGASYPEHKITGTVFAMVQE